MSRILKPWILVFLAMLLLDPSACSKLETRFIPFPGKSDVGGCDAHINNLRDSYSEAIELIKKAQDAIRLVIKPRPGYGANRLQISDADQKLAKQWVKAGRLLKTLFDVDVDEKVGIPDRNGFRVRLNAIRVSRP